MAHQVDRLPASPRSRPFAISCWIEQAWRRKPPDLHGLQQPAGTMQRYGHLFPPKISVGIKDVSSEHFAPRPSAAGPSLRNLTQIPLTGRLQGRFALYSDFSIMWIVNDRTSFSEAGDLDRIEPARFPGAA